MRISDQLKECDLELLCFNSLKNEDHKRLALQIMTNCSKLKPESFDMLCGRTLKRKVYIEKTCRLGLELTLQLYKHQGSIVIYIRKKRTSSLSLLLMDNDFNVIDTWTNTHSKDKDMNLENWKKCLIYEFDDSVVNYIKTGISNKNRNLKKLIKDNLTNPNFHVNIRTDSFTCIV
jgi:hypothetical protein